MNINEVSDRQAEVLLCIADQHGVEVARKVLHYAHNGDNGHVWIDIMDAFTWEDTVEGWRYWSNMHNNTTYP